MDQGFKRVLAYILDIMIATLIVVLISSIRFLNPTIDKYNETYDNYVELVDDYQNGNIEDINYESQLIEFNYDLAKYNSANAIITVVVLVVYFGVVQYFMKGQTLGKRLLKIKVVHVDGRKKLNIWNYLLRGLILNNILFRILIIVGVLFMSNTVYYWYSTIISFIESIIEILILVMILMRKDKRGLHDIISKTKVVDLNETQLEFKKDKNTIEITEVSE